MKRFLCLLLCLASLLTLCACGRQAQPPYAAVIWCAPDDPLLPALRQAVETYNRRKKADAMPVTLRVFESGERMERALDSARPDLLLCSHTLAFPLDENGLLCDAGLKQSYPAPFTDRCEGVGSRVFPLGSRVQLLASAEALSPALSYLTARAAACGAENRRPFLAADSYADLLCQNLLKSGEFHADRDRDCFRPAFQDAWNALAEAAFTGGLYTGPESAAALLIRGELPAAAVYADTLAGILPEGVTLTPLNPEGTPLLADLRCLAVLSRDTRQARGAAAFLRWLLADARAAQLALNAGLIPALPGGKGEGALARTLLALREQTLWLADGGSDYVKNRAAFEKDFRDAMDLLK